ncbi:CBS domain-containing protein [Streptomyces sp. SID14478]|uniref:CBS domain-containing protein n=1 Tax=Streptomyces sp. SID14478 TaxID=2706073 RepID=UPI0013DD80ED|nr:CBS domain-containing protein [Streptomyces sp. SID14478]NEB74255.1 CBS domain-containing protein [Streptomyces sp. SID14478]
MKHAKIGEVMIDDVIAVRYATPFKEVTRLLAEHRISGLPVIDEDDKVIGVISETDLMLHQVTQGQPGTPPSLRARLSPARRRNAAKAAARTAGALMSAPAVTVNAQSTVSAAARTMVQHRVERLPVVDEEERLVGIVTRHDVLQVFLRPDDEIRRTVVDEVLKRALWLTPRVVSVDVREGVVTLTGCLERQSETVIAVAMTSRLDGVVGVVDKLTYRLDDSHLRPDEPKLHGVTDDWLRKL